METSNEYTELIRRLPLGLKLSYGVGHVLNDICASMWFTYLLVYFHLVLQFSPFLSGVILLVGQVADALATPFVGYHCDKDDNLWLCKYGRRKAWHLFGTVCVLLAFPLIFSPCIQCENSHQWAQLFYYSAFVIIFQLGWASVQISHLSLITDLTPSDHERTGLTAIRYSFTVISNVLVYVITWLVLHLSSGSSDAQIGPGDKSKFQNIVFIGLAIGIVTSVIFHKFVNENAQQSHVITQSPGSLRGASYRLKDIQLYQVAVVYMATRLFVNLSQVYIPLYLHETLNMSAESLAIIPLVMFIASFAMSLIIKSLNKICGRKVAFVIGVTIAVSGCLWIRFGEGQTYTTYEIYVVALLLGAGGSVMLVTSLGITADLIGPNTESGAFVYGAMSFTDKLSNGIAVTIIQDIKCLSACPYFYRDVLTYVCGGSALFGLLGLISLAPFTIGSKRKGRSSLIAVDSDQLTSSIQYGSTDNTQTPLLS